MFFTLVAFVGFAAIVLRLLRSKTRNTPPGPPGIFFVGNALQIPKQSPWLKFTEWGKKYGKNSFQLPRSIRNQNFVLGGFVFAQVFTRKLIIINSYELAVELFEKRSANYADRPKRRMAELQVSGMFVTRNSNNNLGVVSAEQCSSKTMAPK